MREAQDSTSVADFMVLGPQAWGPVLVAKLFRAGQALDGGPALPLQDRIHFDAPRIRNRPLLLSRQVAS